MSWQHCSALLLLSVAAGGLLVCNVTPTAAEAEAADPCANKVCASTGYTCWQGQCVLNKCAGKTCPAATTSACTTLAPGVTAATPTCNALTGQCALVVKKADGTPCGAGSVCWKGACVKDKCGNKPCPMISLALCSTIAPGGTNGRCNPTTGECEVGPIVPVPDGQDCGIGVCIKGQCVQKKKQGL